MHATPVRASEMSMQRAMIDWSRRERWSWSKFQRNEKVPQDESVAAVRATERRKMKAAVHRKAVEVSSRERVTARVKKKQRPEKGAKARFVAVMSSLARRVPRVKSVSRRVAYAIDSNDSAAPEVKSAAALRIEKDAPRV